MPTSVSIFRIAADSLPRMSASALLAKRSPSGFCYFPVYLGYLSVEVSHLLLTGKRESDLLFLPFAFGNPPIDGGTGHPYTVGYLLLCEILLEIERFCPLFLLRIA